MTLRNESFLMKEENLKLKENAVQARKSSERENAEIKKMQEKNIWTSYQLFQAREEIKNLKESNRLCKNELLLVKVENNQLRQENKWYDIILHPASDPGFDRGW